MTLQAAVMQVHILSPYRLDKNLGKAYNEAISSIPPGDWACLTDIDVMFLTPDSGQILHRYAELFPSAGLLTCFTNRVSSLSKRQLLFGRVEENDSIRHHMSLAVEQKKHLYSVRQLHCDISGMLMMIKKETWTSNPFPENLKCLGVDTEYGRKLRRSGMPILRMDGLYVFHGYRMLTGVTDKSHLQ